MANPSLILTTPPSVRVNGDDKAIEETKYPVESSVVDKKRFLTGPQLPPIALNVTIGLLAW